MARKPLLSLLIVLTVVLFGARARAASRTLVVYVEGPGADAVRAQIVEGVPKAVPVSDSAAFATALVAAGQHGPFGDAMSASKKREAVLRVMRKAAGTVHADAIVVGQVRRSKKGTVVWLLFLDAAQAEPSLEQTTWLRPGKEPAALQAILRPSFDELVVADPTSADPTSADRSLLGPEPTFPAPAPDSRARSQILTSAELAEAPPSTTRRHDVPTALLDLGVGLEVGGRRFDYTDALPEAASRMRSYGVFGIAAVAASGGVYPFATGTTPVLRDLGITFDVAHAVGLQSSVSTSESSLASSPSISTSYERLGVGLRGRIRTGGATAPVIGIGGGYSYLSFGFDSPPAALEGSLASVAYSSFRLGADARMPFGQLGLIVGADYLAPLSAGEVEERFRDARTGGLDARAGVSVRIVQGLEARLTASYTRFYYSFKPVAGDAYVAGGAVDELLALSAGAAYIY